MKKEKYELAVSFRQTRFVPCCRCGTNPKKDVIITMKKLILASGSPRRREILTMAGYDFSVVYPDADETADGLSPAELVAELSRRKAKAALDLCAAGDVIVTADTVVAMDGEIFGKPGCREKALQMLQRLSGRTHSVFTGFTVQQGARSVTRTVETKVTMRPLLLPEITAYADSGAPLDKAGAYGIQEAAGMFISEISGDYYSVMGLPLCSLSVVLREEFGILPAFSKAAGSVPEKLCI